MAFDWDEAAEGGIAARVPDGLHKLKVIRIINGSKGGVFRSKKGDPQIMVIFGDRHQREVGAMYTLSDKAAWTLAKLLSRCGVDLSALKAGGVEPKHFGNVTLAESWLLNKYTWARVETEIGNDDKPRPKVTPLTAVEAGKGESEPEPEEKREPAKVAAPSHDPFADAPEEDCIPF